MRKRAQSIAVVYLSGLLQGIALVMYPAAGPVFTNPEIHNLSSGQYGALYTPQIILAIIASLAAPRIARRLGMKQVLLLGLLANLLSMIFFAASNFVLAVPMLPFIFLMFGTTALGTGFGFTITAVNPYAYSFFPGREASAITGLHILLGLGTASSSIVLTFFTNLGFWWGAGIFTGGLLFLLSIWVLSLPLEHDIEETAPDVSDLGRIPVRIWLFFLIVFLYGACEATFGNWIPLYLQNDAGLSLAEASAGLSLFWGSIALGRLAFTFAALRYDLRRLHILMPVLVAVVFFSFPYLDGQLANYFAIILGGLGLSFYFPFSISLATDEFPKYAVVISGLMVAAIQLGTGVSSNVVGVLNNTTPLQVLFRFSAIYALIIGGVAWYLFQSANARRFSQIQT